jgi:hypothetical protein
MDSVYVLKKKRAKLIGMISDNLDFLAGSVSTKGLKYEAFNLTTTVQGKTRTKHIPIEIVPLVRTMTARHKTLKELLKELAEVNWLLVREGVDLRNDGSV